MHSACQTGIKGMHGAQNLKRPLWIGDRCLQQRRFVCSSLPVSIAWACIPGRWDHSLVIYDFLVFYFDPMPERTTRRLFQAEALTGLRPALRIPFLTVMDTNISVGHVVIQRSEERRV